MISDDGGDSSSTTFKPFADVRYIDNEDYDIDIPTPAPFVEDSLQQLKEKLDSTPTEMKTSLVYAQQVSADLVNDEHLVGFLYAEKFDIDLALKRLLRYWTSRHKLFGDKYTQPLTLYGAMSDRIEDIRKGYMILLPVLDERGRAIIYANPALMEGKVEETLQVWWYLIHVAMENPSVRKNGFILLANIKHSRLRHFSPKRTLAMVKSGGNDFPVRIQSIETCNPMAVFPLIAPALKAMMSMRLRQNVTIHTGSSDKVLESLAACSIPSTCLPTNMGGGVDTSREAFVRARLTIEGQDNDTMSGNEITSTNHVGSISDISTMNISDSTASSSIPQVTPIPSSSQTSLPQASTIQNTETRAEERKTKYKMPGCKGDSRMNKAVKARHQDPKMSLLAALLQGGFIFPQLYTPGVKMAQVKDTEGVTVYQRKNQLNRRLREERNRKTNREKDALSSNHWMR